MKRRILNIYNNRYKVICNSNFFVEHRIIAFIKFIRWMIYEWLNHDILIKTPDGKIFYTMSRNFSSFVVYFNNFRDPSIQSFMKSHLKKGAIYIDAGANIGTYTIRASELVGENGKVIAIEAHPKIFEYLNKNIILNKLKNVTPLNIALGDREDKISIEFSNANAGETHVSSNSEGTVTKIAQKQLDAILTDIGLIDKIDFLKVDVEGYEIPMLLGARKTIESNKNIIIQTEIVDRHSKRYGRSASEIIEFLRSLKLTPHILDKDGKPSVITAFDLKKDYDVLWWR